MAAPLIVLALACPPPTTTAQQKRLVVGADHRIRVFHGRRLEGDAARWSALLAPSRPAAPIGGPIRLAIRFTYAHPAHASRATRATFVPKTSRPDVDNAAKHLIDVLCRLGFLANDAAVAGLVLEKRHGPTASVGIEIAIGSAAAHDGPIGWA